ncbi:MAG: DNA polymerase III subunit alpha [Candidatus Hydrogenedentales bacterium]|jgi:DNA polymerase-3 subunit alpha
MSDSFVHLHLHTHYSLLDGLTKPAELLKRCADYNMSACAVTDHGTIFGLLDFYLQAKKTGIKPILGCEVYVAPTNRFDKSAKSGKFASNHLLLLCENEQGYHNLCKLSTHAHLEGWHYKPRVDKELLEEYHEGLIVGTACLNGRVPRMLLEDRPEEAEKELDQLIGIFGKDNVFVEMMNHHMEEQEKINPQLWELAQKHGLLAVATNDSHYLDQKDAEAHDVLLCLQTKRILQDTDRMRLPNDSFSLLTAEEMKGRFARWPEAIENSVRIAERCNATIPTELKLIPHYVTPKGEDTAQYLRDRVFEGLEMRYGSPVPGAVRERAEFELNVIEEMQFVNYFLVVWDLVDYARKAGIPVGPGRGSAAGSVIAYALQITNLDPLRYNLLFERFLNPERVSMPDVDIDFCVNRREELIEYLREKYGADCVSQIATFGHMNAKNAVRNVARVLGISIQKSNEIASLIPNDIAITLDAALEKEPELKKRIDSEPETAHLWHLATRVEGTINHLGKHAAGVVLCDHPLTDHIALYKPASNDVVSTQIEMKGVETIGLLKMDLLGLRTLTMIHDTVRLVKKYYKKDVDIDHIHLDDAKTYALLRSGATTGIFQLESAGMRDIAKRIGLESIEEISALVALYRPGPMQFIDTYIHNKHHPEETEYNPPTIKSVLEETYGIPLYQEQVMQLAQLCADFSLGRADILRRAMGKKDKQLLADQKKDFVIGCKKNEINKSLAEDLWKRIETFAGYGFNKSHSMAYAFVAYQTAYLKANYPEAFMCALLTSEIVNPAKTAFYIDECHNLGITVLPPDINLSEESFSLENNAIRFGLSAVKNVGETPCKNIVEERKNNGPYKNIFDFCIRLSGQSINSRCLDSLNKAGVFLSTGWNRNQVEKTMDQAISLGQSMQQERDSGQTSLFDMTDDSSDIDPYTNKPDLPEWEESDILKHEKEMLGAYVSGHPLRAYEKMIHELTTLDLGTFNEMEGGAELTVIGLISEAKKIYTKKGDAMAFLTLETLQGPCEIIVFSRLYAVKKEHLIEDSIIACQTTVNIRDEKRTLIAENLFPISEAETMLTRAIHVRLKPEQQEEDTIHQLAMILGSSHGSNDVFLHCLYPAAHGEVVIHATSACLAAHTKQIRDEVEALLGPGSYFLSSGKDLPSHRPAPIPEDNTPRYGYQK